MKEKMKVARKFETFYTGSLENRKGITLVALTVTMIILLILSGVMITQLRKNGLLNKTELAQEKFKNSQETEISILEGYENEIVGGISRDTTIKNDLELKATSVADVDVKIKIEVKQTYEDATYIYIVNNKIVNHLDTNFAIVGNLEVKTKYQIMVIVVEGNGNIHKGVSQVTTRNESLDVYGEIQNSGKSLADYGITYTRSGKNQTNYNSLYQLGTGSSSGINSNTFTLTIDYDTLMSQLGNKKFNGIYGQFWHNAGTSNGYTSWVYSKIIVTYDDNTTSEVVTEKLTVRNTNITVEPFAAVGFEEGKKVSTIKMIIYEYDSDWGGAYGYIKNIGLIP